MSTRELARLVVGIAVVGCATATVAETPNLGQTVSPAQIAGWDISIQPDGAGLPPGPGTAATGAAGYAHKCQACHGVKGARQPNERLGGGHGTLGRKGPGATHGRLSRLSPARVVQ